MPYATLTELLERIPEGVLIDLTDDDAAGVVDTDKVDRAIGDAARDRQLPRRATPADRPGSAAVWCAVARPGHGGASRPAGARGHARGSDQAARTARSILADIAVRKATARPGDTTGRVTVRPSFSATPRCFTAARSGGCDLSTMCRPSRALEGWPRSSGWSADSAAGPCSAPAAVFLPGADELRPTCRRPPPLEWDVVLLVSYLDR